MGGNKKPAKRDKKRHSYRVHVNDNERFLLDALAAKVGVSTAQFIKASALNNAVYMTQQAMEKANEANKDDDEGGEGGDAANEEILTPTSEASEGENPVV